MNDTSKLWEYFVKKHFQNEYPAIGQSWREVYMVIIKKLQAYV